MTCIVQCAYWPTMGTTFPWQQFPIPSGLFILRCALVNPPNMKTRRVRAYYL